MELTQAYVKSLFDYRDGILYWRIARSNFVKVGDKAGCYRLSPREKKRNDPPRMHVSIDSKLRASSRIIFLYHKGYLPKIVDHEDRNPQNDRIENLRDAGYSDNCSNTTSRKNSTSIYLGVSWSTEKNKWAVYISKHKKRMYGGRFFSEESAALRYNQLAVKYHGEFANLNIIKLSDKP